MTRFRLVGWIPFGRRLLHQQRDDERLARDQLRPHGNCEVMDSDGLRGSKIGPAASDTLGATDTKE